MNKLWIVGLVGAIALMVSAVLVPLARATDGGWHLMINGTSTLDGSSCPSGLTDDMDGTDAIFGTFDWSSNGLTFTYSYDGSSWVGIGANWQSTVYVFDSSTNWGGSIPSSGTFTIHPSLVGSTYDFTCTF